MGLLKKINKIIFINFGGRKKKLLNVFVFSTYIIVFLLKFQLRELVGYGIWLCMQRVPTLHTFDGPCYPKNKKYLKKGDDGILVGCGTWFCIQQALSIEIWVKT